MTTISLAQDPRAVEALRQLRRRSSGPAPVVLSNRRIKALSELGAAARRAAEVGWDGYDAQPIVESSYELARKFLIKLPAGVCDPADVDVDPQGRVIFEWQPSENELRRVIFDPSGELVVIAVGDGEPVAFRAAMGGEAIPEAVVAVLCSQPSA